MNFFSVDWEKSAEMQLAVIWLNASDPPAVTAASAQIERLLAQDPLKIGRHLSEGLYELTILPLAVFYTVDQVHRKVIVSDVGLQL